MQDYDVLRAFSLSGTSEIEAARFACLPVNHDELVVRAGQGATVLHLRVRLEFNCIGNSATFPSAIAVFRPAHS